MLRNLCVAIGNWLADAGDAGAEATQGTEGNQGTRRTREGVAVLERAIRDDQALVRAHAAWALGRAAGPQARDVLERRLVTEEEESVRAEITAALEQAGGRATSA